MRRILKHPATPLALTLLYFTIAILTTYLTR